MFPISLRDATEFQNGSQIAKLLSWCGGSRRNKETTFFRPPFLYKCVTKETARWVEIERTLLRTPPYGNDVNIILIFPTTRASSLAYEQAQSDCDETPCGVVAFITSPPGAEW